MRPMKNPVELLEFRAAFGEDVKLCGEITELNDLRLGLIHQDSNSVSEYAVLSGQDLNRLINKLNAFMVEMKFNAKRVA